MKLLVLGGTVFLGRAVAASAVAAGHQVTCAARGRSGAVPAGAELVTVDRDAPDGLAGLAGRGFDAVVDVARRPSYVRAALAALGADVGHWTFVSTGSVYADVATPDQDPQSTALVEPAPSTVDDPDVDGMEYYGPLKVVCEQEVLAGPVPAFICRAGLIVGPQDPSDRFTYWPVRLARGGPVLAPGAPTDPTQCIDVRDLADWIVLAGQRGLTGTFNGTGATISRAEFLASVAAGVGAPDPELVWVSQDTLVAAEVRPWAGERSLPLWLPLPEYAGFQTRRVSASFAAGLHQRDLAQTAADTLAWYREQGEPQLRCGLSADAEAAVLRTI